MTWRWTKDCWTNGRRRLAHAVYEKTRKEAPYAPMASLGAGNVLMRSFKRSFLGQGVPDAIASQVVLESIRVRDANLDQNRFTGPLERFGSKPAVSPARGGLYCSQDIRAALAELLHYKEQNLSRALIGRPKRPSVFGQRGFVSLRAVGELSVASLDSSSPAMLRFLTILQRDPEVTGALAVTPYEDLFKAIYAAQDYSAARGLGLGLESNSGIDGLQVISARDYEVDVDGQRVLRTGDNVLLFGLDQCIAMDKVRVESLHLVDKVAGRPELLVTHYASAPRGEFRQSGTARFVP